MQSLGKLPAGDLLSSGLYPGLHGESSPLWIDGQNVVFDNLGVRKSEGLVGVATLPVQPSKIQTTFADNEARAFVGSGDKAYRYRTSDGLTQIASFADSGVYNFVPWDTWALINNGVNVPKLWKNTGMAAAITAPFSRANVIVPYGLRAIAFGTDNGGTFAEWCSINNIEDWTPTILNSAGNLRLRTLSGDIVAVKPLGPYLGVYSSMMGGVFSEIGGTITYGFRNPISGVRAISQNAIVVHADRHYGVTPENAFITNLSSYQYIDEPAIRNFLKTEIDWNRSPEVYGWVDLANSMIRWALPIAGGEFIGIGVRTDRGTWTIFDDDVALGEPAGAFPYMLAARGSRLLRQTATNFNLDGGVFESFAQSKPLDFGTRNRLKRIQKVSVDAKWVGSPQIDIGYSAHPNDAPTWVHTADFANEIFPDQENQQCEGAFIHFRFRSSSLNSDWKLFGVEVYGEYTGNVT